MSFIPTNKILSQITGTVSTTDATVTTVAQIPTHTDTGTLIAVEVIGTRTGGSGGVANDMIVVRLLSEYKNISDTVTLFGTPEKYSNKDNVNCDVNLVISGANVNVRVTGDANNNYDWSAKATFFSLSMGAGFTPTSPFSAEFATPATASPSGTIPYGTPTNGDTIVFTGFPTNGTFTFTKDDSTDFNTTFSTIDELVNLINNKDDIQAANNDPEVTILVQTPGAVMNSATITGTGSYSGLNITFSGGISGFLTATDPMSFRMGDTDSFIVGFWVQLESYPAGILIKKDDGWANGDNFLLSVDGSGNINTHTRVAAAGGQSFGGGNIPLSTPTFVVYWKNVADTSLNISVNGQAPSSFTYGGATSFSGGAGDFVLGTDGPVGGVLGNYIDGRLDEVFICKNPADMSAAIALINSSIYNDGAGKRYYQLNGTDKTTLGLISWWTMDEASGTRTDSQGTVGLTPNSDVSQGDPIVPAGASARNTASSGNWLDIADNMSLKAQQNDSVIWGGWVNAHSFADYGYLIAKGDDWNGAGADYAVLIEQNTSDPENGTTLTVEINHDGTNMAGFDSADVIKLDTPAFVLCWYKQSDNTLNIQINNGAVTSNTVFSGRTADPNGNGPFTLFANGSSDGTIGLNCDLDEIFFCKNPSNMDTAISTIQTSIYNGGIGKTYAELTSGEKTTIGLVSWWGLNDASDASRKDLHGSNNLMNHGDIQKAPPIVPHIIVPYSASNAATSGNYLTAGNPSSLQLIGSDSFLLGGWINWDSATHGTILTKGNVDVGSESYGLQVKDDSNPSALQFFINDSTEYSVTSDDLISVGTPAFVLVWGDSSQTHIQINNGTVTTASTVRTNGSDPGGNVNFFALDDGGTGGTGLLGKLDEWFFCKNPSNLATAVSTVQTSIYNGGVGKQYHEVSSADKTAMGLVSWWTFNEPNNATRYDSFGSNHLTNNGTISQAAPIVPATPLPFSASTSPDSANFLLATNPTSLRANSTDTMIFGYWINVNNANNNGIAWKTDPNTSGYNYYLSTEGGGHPELLFLVNPSGSSIQVDSSTVVTTGTNHFILCWIDPATTSVNIQVDGGSVDSADYSGIAAPYTAGAGDFYVCKSADDNLLLDGAIDEFFVCKNPSNLATAISTIQSSIYNGGTGKRYHNVTPTEKTDIGLVSWWGMDEATNTTRKDLHGSNDLANNGTVSQTAPIVS